MKSRACELWDVSDVMGSVRTNAKWFRKREAIVITLWMSIQHYAECFVYTDTSLSHQTYKICMRHYYIDT